MSPPPDHPRLFGRRYPRKVTVDIVVTSPIPTRTEVSPPSPSCHPLPQQYKYTHKYDRYRHVDSTRTTLECGRYQHTVLYVCTHGYPVSSTPGRCPYTVVSSPPTTGTHARTTAPSHSLQHHPPSTPTRPRATVPGEMTTRGYRSVPDSHFLDTTPGCPSWSRPVTYEVMFVRVGPTHGVPPVSYLTRVYPNRDRMSVLVGRDRSRLSMVFRF